MEILEPKHKYRIGDLVDVIINDQIMNPLPAEIVTVYPPPRDNADWGYYVRWDGYEGSFEESNLKPTVQKAIAPTWGIKTLHDARKPRPPLQYVIGDIFVFGSLNIIFGAPGSLKSMLLADMAVSVAAGRQWLCYPVTAVPVLWVDLDNGLRRTHERFDAIANAYQLGNHHPLYYTSMPDPPMDATNQKAIKILEQYIADLGTRFVIIDNLGLVSGATDENSAGMAAIMGRFRTLADKYNACITLVHHQRKSMQTTNKARSGESLRGHTSIEAALDLALLVMRNEQSNEIIVKSTKDRSVPVNEFAAKFEFTHRSGTKELEMAWFSQNQHMSEFDLFFEEVAKVLNEQGPMNLNNLAEAARGAVGIGRDKAKAWIGNLVTEQKLIEEAGLHNSRVFRLADAFDFAG